MKSMKSEVPALELLLKEVLTNSKFDYAMVRVLRRIVANFLKKYPNLPLNDLPINLTFQGDYKTMSEYLRSNVLIDKEDASTATLSVIPLALRYSLIIVMLFPKDETKVFFNSAINILI